MIYDIKDGLNVWL